MKIVHVCLSNWYVDGVGYQENELIRQHTEDNHEVFVIASTETHGANGKLCNVKPAIYIGKESAPIIRIPYAFSRPNILAKKLRIHKYFRDLLHAISPDIILFHGTCGWELLTVVKYVQKHKHTVLYVDSHEDKYNSATNWLSRELLHKRYYRPILVRALPAIKKILCYSPESIEFVHNLYGISLEKLELYPLGGRPVLDSEYVQRRSLIREQFKINNDQVLIIQSGKQTRRKKLIESVKAFSSCRDKALVLLIAGNIDNEVKGEFYELMENDSRIRFLGWQSFDDLTSLLCAADVYLQPGTQSVTMQHSLCCRCAVILDDVPSHYFYVRTNGWLIGRDGSLNSIFASLSKADLDTMKSQSFGFAKAILDYKILAQRILA